jgi:Nuclease-related domain
MNLWVVKHDGVCSRCGASLLRGSPAIWDRATRSIHCIECPAAPGAPDPPAVDSGRAGGSARREHQRLVDRRDAAIDERWGRRVGRVVRAVTQEPQSTRAWAIGAGGEEKLADAFAGVEGLRALHDRGVRGTRRNIDHVVVSAAGVFIVDAKHYRGRIEIRNRGWFFRPDLRLYVGGRDRSQLARDMAWQVEAVAAALNAAGVDPLPPITPVLCFVDGEWPLVGAPDEFEGVRLESDRTVLKLVSRSRDLDAATIDRLTATLAAALPPR